MGAVNLKPSRPNPRWASKGLSTSLLAKNLGVRGCKAMVVWSLDWVYVKKNWKPLKWTRSRSANEVFSSFYGSVGGGRLVWGDDVLVVRSIYRGR